YVVLVLYFFFFFFFQAEDGIRDFHVTGVQTCALPILKFADSIYAAGHDLLAMINDILDISKVEAGKLDVRLDKFVLSRMLLALTEQFRALAQQKEIDVELVIDPSAPVTLYSDRHRLEQILR